VFPADSEGRVDIPALLTHLGQRQVLSLMVEGGGQVLGSFFEEGAVQEVWAFLAPMIIGGAAAPGPVGGLGIDRLSQAAILHQVSIDPVGKDWLLRAKVETSARSSASNK
jgi:diaminohydroxyphosphoribosylaminopyrimidine deaminase/5-amino-6-(5-phosphoribosylamino)uracil reductase